MKRVKNILLVGFVRATSTRQVGLRGKKKEAADANV